MDPSSRSLPLSAAEAAERAAERLDLALRGSRLTLWDVDLVQGQVYLNEQWSTLLGRAGGESVVSLTELQELMHPDDTPRVLAAFVAAVKGETADYAVEHRVKVADGSWKWIVSHGMVTRRDESGRALRMTGTNADIDERKRNEERLNAALLEQQALLAASPAGVYIVGDDRRVRQANEAMERMCGYGRHEMVGLPTRAFCADEMDWRRIGTEGYSRMRSEGLLRTELRIRRKDGSEFWGLVQGVAIDPRNESQGRLFTAVDISEQKRTQAALRSALLEQRALLAASPAGVFTVSTDRRIVQANSAMERLFGYSQSEFLGMSTRQLCATEEVWRWIGTKGYLQIASEGLMRAEILYRRKDGTVFWGYLQGVPIDRDSPEKGRLFAVVDISPQKNLENSLRDADRRKDTFIATLAHELRNPLAPIRNAVSILRQVEAADPKQAWCREVIERQVAQMAHLLEDLLDVSRITSGKMTLRRERLDLERLVDQAVEIARPLIDEGGHSLEMYLPPTPVELDGDRTRLAQVFSNLLTNAAKYSERGGRIVLSASVRQAELVVSVKDTGIGIATEHLPGIFEMFSQVDLAMNRSQGGLGLGLSLVKGLVEMHGGRVHAASEGHGKGSEFVVTLPLPEQSRKEPAAPERAATSKVGSGARVLVVDDSPDVAMTLALLCELDGHEVQTAGDGVEAVARAESFRPHLVLLDLGMPRMNGLDACRAIRAQPWSAGMKLVALTGWGQEEDKRKTEEAGFDQHLVKPVDPAVLSSLLAGIHKTSP